MASTACPAKVCSKVGMVGAKRADSAPADHQPADDLVLAQQRHRQDGMDAGQQSTDVLGNRRILLHVVDMHGHALTAARPRWVSPMPDFPFAQCRPPAPRSCRRRIWARRLLRFRRIRRSYLHRPARVAPARLMMVASTVSRSSEEFTARTPPRAPAVRRPNGSARRCGPAIRRAAARSPAR